MTKEKTAQPRGTTSRQARSYSCRKKFDHVYQFKISFQDIKPTIWRRIQVPERYSFWDLHCAITDSLGWLDYHLHEFTIGFPISNETHVVGIPDDEGFEDRVVLPGWDVSIAEYFSMENTSCEYEYDFGDGWRHSVVLEKILPREEGVVYPRCISGERACPPEDVGGPPGYGSFLKAIGYVNAPDHDRLLEWCGGWFDPEWFDLGLVRFGSPQKRWGIAFDNESMPRSMRTVQYHRMQKDSSDDAATQM
ncbi:MAG: hypothetical protein ACI9OU_002220 [Candidatus Promineifilaceae bacterium]|jgi:hypothetical protein